MKEHQYSINLEWTGNNGSGTSAYRSYSRDHTISAVGKETQIMGSSDPSFLGDPSCYNPEDLLVSSLSACHMLWYLHLCSANGIVVTSYTDHATGVMEQTKDGGGQFREVTLRPRVTIKDSKMVVAARQLHQEANKKCFIANSCNFKVGHEPEIAVE